MKWETSVNAEVNEMTWLMVEMSQRVFKKILFCDVSRSGVVNNSSKIKMWSLPLWQELTTCLENKSHIHENIKRKKKKGLSE